MSVPDALRRSELAAVWRQVHNRLSSGRPVSRVRVGPLDDDQKAAVADLLGLDRLPGEFATFHLARLDALLVGACGLTSREVVRVIVGPLDNVAERRATVQREREELWSWVRRHPVVEAQPALLDWVADVRRAGLAGGDVPAARDLLTRALDVIGALPSAGEPLPAFADRILGDPHALDDRTRLAAVVLRAVAAINGAEVPTSAGGRRALWEQVGVACNALSTTVLVGGLRTAGDGALAQSLRLWADASEACAVTLAQLASASELTADGDVWIVENPAVLEIALRRLGRRMPPLVCTSGWPNGAGIGLLQRLASGGATLHYHGDFDGDGLRIAAYIMATTAARPWRMSSADYLAGLGNPAAAQPSVTVGSVPDTPWDPGLAEAMRDRDVALPEERIADTLVGDLVRAADAQRPANPARTVGR